VTELQLGGIDSNQTTLLRILQSAEFQAGIATTALMGRLGQAAAPSTDGGRGVISSNINWDSRASQPATDRTRELLSAGLTELGAVAAQDANGATRTPGAIVAPTDALLVDLRVSAVGQFMRAGETVAIVSAMKMEQQLQAPFDGVVRELGSFRSGSRVPTGAVLAVLEEADASSDAVVAASQRKEHTWYDNPPSSGGGSVLEIQRIKELAMKMGGEENLQRQKAQGRRNVRERIEGLLDAGSFNEVGVLAGFPTYNRDGSVQDFLPTNCVGGSGTISGRLVVTACDDFSIRGGHADGGSAAKQNYMERLSREMRCPIVRFLDGSSGGGSLVSTVGKSAAGGEAKDKFKGTLADGSTYLPRNPSLDLMAVTLNEVPQVAILGGPVVGLASARAVMTHFSVMIRGLSQLFVAGPPVVEGTGQAPVTKEELGGVGVHGANGSVDNIADTEEEAMSQVAQFLSYLPASCWELPPAIETWDEPASAEELISVIPTARQRSFDVREVITRVADRDSFFEIGGLWGRDQVTGLARLGGRTVGILAQDSRHDGGGMSADGGRKIARFVELVNTFHVPMLSFVDCPGFVVGVRAESSSTIRFGGQAMGQLYSSKVPWFTVVLRRAFGVAGAMLASRQPSDVRVAWPSADWGSLPPEGGIQAGFKRVLANHPEPQQVIQQVLDKYNATRSPLRTAAQFGVEEIIDPRATRAHAMRWMDNAYRILAHPDRLGPKPGGFHIY